MATVAGDEGKGLECGLCDVEEVDRLTQALLVALAAACVEKTSGTFSQRAAVVPDVKKAMLEYLNQQSESYANGDSPKLGNNLVAQPIQVVNEMLESFIKSRKSILSRVSGIVLAKDGKIDDFLHELDRSGVWLPARREALAKALVKRTDQRKTYHCDMRFESEKELVQHQMSCGIRPVSCSNEGCDAVFSAIHAESHDASCVYKLLPCLLDCESSVRRKDMEYHCATVCPMKKSNCPYHSVGCTHVMAQGLLESHCAEYMGRHLLETLQFVQKHEVALGDHAQRLLLVEKAVQLAQRSEDVNMRNLNVTLKEQDNKVKLLEAEVKKLKAANQKTADHASAEVAQLKREFQNFQRQVGSLTSSQSPR